MAREDDTDVGEVGRADANRVEAAAAAFDPSELPTAAFDPNAPFDEENPKAVVQAALQRAQEGVNRSERLTAQRQAERVEGGPIRRFGRHTVMRVRELPRLSQVFGDRIGKKRGLGPVVWVLVLASLVAGLYAARFTLEGARSAEARDVLAHGSLEELADMVAGASAWDRWLDGAGVLLAADAILFRYGDAEPKRRERVLKALEGRRGDAAVLARALVSDVDVRARLLSELQSSIQSQWVLTASVSALQHIGDSRLAQQNLARLVKEEKVAGAAVVAAAQVTDPTHAGRLWETLAERGREREGWWTLATRELQPGEGAELPPVAAAEGHFARALTLLKNKKRRDAERHLERVAQFVAYQPTFLVELAARMLDAGQPAAARTLLEQMEGESGPYAEVLRGRLLLAEGKTERGLELLEAAWKSGEREPTLLRELIDRGRLTDEDAILDAFARWPRNTELVLSRAEQLIGDERYDEASTVLRERLLWLVAKAGDEQRARCFTLLARAEGALGNVAGARNYLERALAEKADYRPAKKLVSELKADP